MAAKVVQIFCLALVAFAAAAAAPAGAAPFTAGNLLVERLDTTSLSNSAAPIRVVEYAKTGGSPVQTISLPTSGPNRQTDSPTATSNGSLNTYGGYVSVPGVNVSVGTTAPDRLDAKINSILDTSGTVVTHTLFPAVPNDVPYRSGPYRSSIATSGSTFYTAGSASFGTSSGGIWYTDGSRFFQLSATSGSVTDIRNVEIYNNQLYFSSQSGAFLGVSSLGTGLPTSGPQTAALQIDLGTGGSAYGFVMFDTNGDHVLDRAYVADDRATAANGGINRFDFSGNAWSRTSAFRFDNMSRRLSSGTSGTHIVSIRGLTGTYDPLTSTASLFATTTESTNNQLISFVDSGSLSTSTKFLPLGFAGANNVFRGVDLAPVPEPSTFVLVGLGIAAAGWTRWRRRVNGGHVKL